MLHVYLCHVRIVISSFTVVHYEWYHCDLWPKALYTTQTYNTTAVLLLCCWIKVEQPACNWSVKTGLLSILLTCLPQLLFRATTRATSETKLFDVNHNSTVSLQENYLESSQQGIWDMKYTHTYCSHNIDYNQSLVKILGILLRHLNWLKQCCGCSGRP